MSLTLNILNNEFCKIKLSKFGNKMFKPSGCKEMGIIKIGFVAKT